MFIIVVVVVAVVQQSLPFLAFPFLSSLSPVFE